jgi:Gas vesicle protein G
MLLIDDLLFSGLTFVLDKLATVVDQEMNDESRLHQTLMEAQMRFEMGEITADEFAGIERTVIDRLREIRAEREAGAPSLSDEGVRISSVEISGPDADVDVEMPVVDLEGPAAAANAAAAGDAIDASAKTARARGSANSAKPGQPRASGARRKTSASTKRSSSGRGGARR